MAEIKNKSGDSQDVFGTTDPWENLLIIIILAAILGYLLERFYTYWRSDQSFWEFLLFQASKIALYLWPVALALCLLFLAGIIYSLKKLNRLNRELKLRFNSGSPIASPAPAAEPENKEWRKVLECLGSDNPADWRLAVLEADLILEAMVNRMGYRGDSLGQKLARIEPSDFHAIEQAREAHRRRNAIAREGGNFNLTKEEAQRIVGLYREVFKEFLYI